MSGLRLRQTGGLKSGLSSQNPDVWPAITKHKLNPLHEFEEGLSSIISFGATEMTHFSFKTDRLLNTDIFKNTDYSNVCFCIKMALKVLVAADIRGFHTQSSLQRFTFTVALK